MISQTAEYALRAAVCLAVHYPAHHTAEQIARATKVPVGYLAKVLRDLNKAGLVNAQRGQHGGYSLADAPAEVSVLDVVMAVDGGRRIQPCPLDPRQPQSRPCALHRLLDQIAATAEESFRSATLAALVADPTSRPLCTVAAPSDHETQPPAQAQGHSRPWMSRHRP